MMGNLIVQIKSFFFKGSSGYDTENGELSGTKIYILIQIQFVAIPDDDGIRGKRIQILENPQEIDLIQDYGNVSYHFQTDLIILKLQGRIGTEIPLKR